MMLGRSENSPDATATDRAVSEVVAFVLVFGIVIASVSVLYGVGFAGLADIHSAEQSSSGQQAFEALAVGFDEIQRDRGPNRLSNIDLSGRSLHLDDDSGIEVTVGGETVESSGALVYRGDGTDIAYEAGAVIRSDGGDAQIVTREPRFRCTTDGDRAVISLVSLESDRSGAVSSSGSIGILAEQQDPGESRLAHTASGNNLEVTIDFSGSEYSEAWRRHFEDQGWVVGSDEATCELDDDAVVYVRHTEIEIDYIGI